MAELKDWDTSAANNNSSPPDGWPENMSYANVNNTARENMAVLARWFNDTNGTLTTGGSGNAYTLTPNRTVSAYSDGDCYCIEASFTNTSAATLNVSSLGAKNIVLQNGDALTGGEIKSGGRYCVSYDGTNFQLFSPSFDGQRIFAKSADQTSTASMADDNHITFSVESSTDYLIELKLYLEVGADANTEFDFTFSGGVVAPSILGSEIGGGAVVQMIDDDYTATLSGSDGMVQINASVTTISGGNLTLRFQGGTSGDFNVLKKNSVAVVTKLS